MISVRKRKEALCSPERLYEDNLKLVDFSLKRFPSLTGEDREEACGVGMLALWKAAQNFDPGRGFQFGSYAVPCIRGEILRHLKTQRRQVQLPCVSLETPIGDNGSDLAEIIADERAEKPGQALQEDTGFEGLLSLLPERQSSLLRKIYKEEISLLEISKERDISRQRAQQLQMAALEKLRKAVRQQEKDARQAEAQNIRRLAARQVLGYGV